MEYLVWDVETAVQCKRERQKKKELERENKKERERKKERSNEREREGDREREQPNSVHDESIRRGWSVAKGK